MNRLITQNHVPANRSGLVFWSDYCLTGSVAATGTMKEYSGLANHGTLVNNAFVDKNGINLDGSSHVDCANDASLFPTAKLSLSTVIKLSSHAGVIQGILDTSGSGSWGGYLLSVHTDRKIKFNIYHGSTSTYEGTKNISIVSDAAIDLDTLYKIDIVFDGSTVKMYLNLIAQADEKSASSISYADAGTNLDVGRYYSNTYAFNGTIQSTKVYKRGLSSGETKTNYFKNPRF